MGEVRNKSTAKATTMRAPRTKQTTATAAGMGGAWRTFHCRDRYALPEEWKIDATKGLFRKKHYFCT
jgi:hypothetical protein